MSLANSPAELEVRRIARLVAVDPYELDGLEALDPTDLRTLRDQIAARLYDEHTDSWERAVAVSGVVPTGLAAKLTERALGPVLAARITGLTPPQKAVDIGDRLPPSFLADVAVNLDPRRALHIIAELPPDTIASVSRELEAREEWLVMADFVAAVSTPALRATVAALGEEAILRVGVLLEDAGRITEVASLLDDARVARLREVAADRGLEEHLAFLADAAAPPQADRLAG